MNSRELRDVYGVFATGVTVVTCRGDEHQAHGATVTAFTPISLDPPLVQVSLTRTSRACGHLNGRPFAVNILGEHQLDVAWHFAGRPAPEVPTLLEGPVAPILGGSLVTISCTPWTSYDGGDHVLFLGRVVDVTVRDGAPLLFHRSGFTALGPALGASAWAGCSDDPHTGWFDATTDFRPAHLAAPRR